MRILDEVRGLLAAGTIVATLALAACREHAPPTNPGARSAIASAGYKEPSLEDLTASVCEKNPAPPVQTLTFSPSLPPLPRLSAEDEKHMPAWLDKLSIGPWNGQQGVYRSGDDRLAIVLGYDPAIAFSVAKDGALATRQLVWISDFDGDGVREPATIDAGRVTVWFKSGPVEFNSDLSAIVGFFPPVARIVERGNRAVVLLTPSYDWPGFWIDKKRPLGEWRKHAFSAEDSVAISFAPSGARVEEGLAADIYREESPLWKRLFGRELCGDALAFDARGRGPASWAARLEALGVPASRARVLVQHRHGCLDDQKVPPRDFDPIAQQIHEQFLRRARQRFSELDLLAFRSCTSANGERIEAVVSHCPDDSTITVNAWTILDSGTAVSRDWFRFGSDEPRPTCGPDLPYDIR